MDSSRAASITFTVALHAAALAALLQLDAVRKPLLDAMPMMVNLIAPPKPEPPPEVIPPKPLPVARQPVPRPAELPLLAAQSVPSSASPIAPQPVPAPAPVVTPPAAAPVVQAVARVVPPNFDAAYLRNPPPAYPALSKRRGEQGSVMLRVYVNADGGAEKVLIRTSSGFERLDQAAHDAVHQWRFVPARQGDQPVAAWVLVPISFALEN